MADDDYQRRSWSGVGPEVSSFDEIISGVFDDALLMKYVEKYHKLLSDSARALADNLDRKITSLDFGEVRGRMPAEILDDPQWSEIRNIAGSLAIELDKLEL